MLGEINGEGSKLRIDESSGRAGAVGGPRHQKENEHREGVENGVLAG